MNGSSLTASNVLHPRIMLTFDLNVMTICRAYKELLINAFNFVTATVILSMIKKDAVYRCLKLVEECNFDMCKICFGRKLHRINRNL